MFDKLVESQKVKNGRKVGRYLTATAILYSTVLAITAIVTIVGYGPVLAEYEQLVCIFPPAPANLQDSTPQIFKPAKGISAPGVGRAFANPNESNKVVSNLPPGADKLHKYAISGDYNAPPGDLPSSLNVEKPGSDGEVPPPPPAIKPAPSPDAKPTVIRQSEGVLQGGAINKVKPAYPEFAKKIRAGGIVQVQVLISEDGRVLQAKALNGHALLQKHAEDAARQWRFSPTTLSKVPVMVQGIISFNFVLN